jgi:DNA modification methylase
MTPYYQHAGITIYHGDCREVLEALQADLLLTDPPYGIALRNGDVDGHRSKHWSGVRGDDDQTLGQFALDWAARRDIPAIVFSSPWRPWPGDWRNLIVWDKGGAVGGGGDIKTCLKRSWELVQVARNREMPGPRAESVWKYPVAPAEASQHIAAKPVRLMTALLKQFGGQNVIDPFMGGGSTLIAAKLQNIRATGIEIEERYCEIAAKRLAQEVFEFEP